MEWLVIRIQIVNMGCIDKSFCPTIFLPKVIEWNLEDQKEHSIEKVMENKKWNKKSVKELVAKITITDGGWTRQKQKIFLAELIGTFLVIVFAKCL